MCSALVQGVIKASCTISGIFIVSHFCACTVWRFSGGRAFWRASCWCFLILDQSTLFRFFFWTSFSVFWLEDVNFFFWSFFILAFMWLALVCFIFYFGVLHYKRFWTSPFYLKSAWILAFCFLFWRFVDLVFFDLRLRIFLRFLDFGVLHYNHFESRFAIFTFLKLI